MRSFLLEPTAAAGWQTLVKQAETANTIRLNESLESYLVFLLLRFTSHPELTDSILGVEFLQSSQLVGKRQKQDALQEVGDKCLLISGLFPGYAEKRLVHVSYYVDLGRTAYASLAQNEPQGSSELYTALCKHFVVLMDVLLAMREIASEVVLLPLQAAELWSETDSKKALKILNGYTQATFIDHNNPSKH